MQRQCIYDALSTEAVVCGIGDPAEDEKLIIRDFVILAERLAITLSACGLVHAIF